MDYDPLGRCIIGMVGEGESPLGEGPLTRLVVLVEGVPSFEFTLRCDEGTKVSTLFDKMRQYYYSGAAEEDLFADEKCSEQVALTSSISGKK